MVGLADLAPGTGTHVAEREFGLAQDAGAIRVQIVPRFAENALMECSAADAAEIHRLAQSAERACFVVETVAGQTHRSVGRAHFASAESAQLTRTIGVQVESRLALQTLGGVAENTGCRK